METTRKKIEEGTEYERKSVLIVDITEEINQVIHQLAEEATAYYINSLRENNDGNFVNRFFRGVINSFKRNAAELSRSYIYHQFRKQIEEEVKNNYNLFQRIAVEGVRASINLEDRERMSEFLRLAIERFESNIADRFSRDVEIGQRIESHQNTPLKNLIAEMVRDFIQNPNLDSPAGRLEFNSEFSRRLKILIDRGEVSAELFYGSEDKRIASSPEMFSTNIYDYVVAIKREISTISQESGLTEEQKNRLNEYISRLTNIDIQLSRLSSSVRTKIPDAGKRGTSDYTLSRIEELCLRLESVPVLNKIINPITVGLASSILSREALIKIGGRSFAAAAAGSVLGSLGYLTGPILVGSVLSGIFAYYRGKTRFKQDTGRILREQAAGLEITDPRARSVLERISLSGGNEFRKNIYELVESIRNGDENAYKEAVARLELEFESRKEESSLPQLDLLISNGEWRSSFIEKYELERAILEFESRISQERRNQLRQEIDNIKEDLREKILQQDAAIKREATKIGLRNGVLTGAVAFALGSSVQYIRDLIGETQWGEKLSESPLGQIIATRRAKERIGLIEYILGERPRAAKEGFTTIIVNGQEIIVPDHEKSQSIEKVINLPGGHYAVAKFNPETKEWHLDLPPETKTAGWIITEKGFELHQSGISGTILENWEEIKNRMGLKTERISWVDFAWEKKPPKVISWEVPSNHPGFYSEGLELSMSFKKAPDGDVYIKVPVVGIAFRKGGPSWDIAEFVKQGKAMVVISPRDKILQYDGLIFEVKPENIKGSFAEIRIPKNLADILFTESGGRVRPNGTQVTYNLEVGFSEGKHRLVEIAADYSPRELPIQIPGIHEGVPVSFKETPPIPPAELDPPIAIPPLIEWKTPKPGVYKEPSLPVRPPEYPAYYTHGYWASVEWIRRFGKTIPENFQIHFIQLKEKEEKLREIQIRLTQISKELKEITGEDHKKQLRRERRRLYRERRKILEEIKLLKLEIERTIVARYIEDWDRDFELLFQKETLRNLFRMNNFYGERYKSFIEHLASKIPPMKDKTRVAVYIPAYHEGKFIGRTLEEYIKQIDLRDREIDPDLYEIVILDNKREGESWDDTQKIVEEFKKRHPNTNIHYLQVTFPSEIAGVGLARRILTDVILLRSNQRANSEGPLYLITEDADLQTVDPQIIIKTIKRFDRFPHLDILRGLQVRDPKILAQHDLLLFERMGANIQELLFRSHYKLGESWYNPEVSEYPDPFSWARIISGGWNTAITALCLSEIGGYDPRLKIGEDLFVGNALSISRSRENDSQGRPVPNLESIKTIPTKSSSSMRRFIFQLFKNAYGEFGSSELERTVREMSEEQILAQDIMKQLERINKSNLFKFEEYINWWIRNFYVLTQDPEEAKRRSDLLLRLFLLREEYDYKWEGNRIKLNESSINRLKLNFELFRLYVQKFGSERMIRTKMGIWPVWSGFKVPTSLTGGTFQLIQEIAKQIGKDYDSSVLEISKIVEQENEIIEQFFGLSEDRKIAIVEYLARIKS
ncbi:MAG: hypothetical protein KatS3mg095_0387 [Candidatus Parcubacteria bacterium]|nr:MAG: hypothetical protein KatS3mg095_0387 [Candidatus Parcubacteria bacterium]